MAETLSRSVMNRVERIRSSRANYAWLLGAVFVVALVIRLFKIGDRNVWLDEVDLWLGATSTWRSSQMAPLPLWIHGAWFWFLHSNTIPFALHLPSVLFGALAVLSTAALARELFDRRAAVAAAAFMALSPMGIFYSQEARPYSLLFNIVALCIVFFLRARRYGNARDWLLCAAFAAAGSLTHALSVLVVGALVLWAVIDAAVQRDPRPAVWPVLLILPAAVAGMAWVLQRTLPVDSVVETAYPAGILSFLREIFYGLGPEISDTRGERLRIDLLAAGMFVAAAAGVDRLWNEKKRLGWLPIIMFALLLPMLFKTMGQKIEWKWVRYVSPLLPVYLALMAGGCFSARLGGGRFGAKVAIVVTLLFLPGFHRWVTFETYDRSHIARNASQQLSVYVRDLTGFIIITPQWVPRPIAVTLFGFFRTDGLPTYILREGEVRSFPGRGYVFIDNNSEGWVMGSMPAGDYLVLNWTAWHDGREGVADLLKTAEVTRYAERNNEKSDLLRFEIYRFK